MHLRKYPVDLVRIDHVVERNDGDSDEARETNEERKEQNAQWSAIQMCFVLNMNEIETMPSDSEEQIQKAQTVSRKTSFNAHRR